MASTVFHPASTRMHGNIGWLDAYRSFQPTGATEPSRQSFGALFILNDDTVAGGGGFGMHAHQNAEIMTLLLEGALEHEDTLGNKGVISTNELQIISAGAGIAHSEKNHSATAAAHFLQIWFTTDQPGAAPHYDQVSFDTASQPDSFVQVVSPHIGAAGVQVRQQAWLHVGTLTPGTATGYAVKRPGNGVYAFVLEGQVRIGGRKLGAYDAVGTWDTDQLTVEALSPARVLLIDVPMQD